MTEEDPFLAILDAATAVITAARDYRLHEPAAPGRPSARAKKLDRAIRDYERLCDKIIKTTDAKKAAAKPVTKSMG